ncbi:MAG TPA: ribulose-phosphate 3-epimerase [Kiritimatiellia bacterium]|nr:ribulose-phosphate 3-epimerase [Kiritimatiellia bacterium]
MNTGRDIPSIKILPSLLAADMGNLAVACQSVMNNGADGVHLDIMDGHFVPNLSMGPDFVAMSARVAPDLYRHVHLMVTRPHELADAFMDAGAQTLLFHVEAQSDCRELIAHIRGRGVKPGLVLNPETPLDAVLPFVSSIDEVLFMTVHPGFGGQAFLDHVLPKMAELHRQAPELLISVDGGINLENAPKCAASGTSIFIAGTSLFRATDMKKDITTMRESCREAFA